ncbi:hypothetical protein [Streptomyces sp. NPDC001153]
MTLETEDLHSMLAMIRADLAVGLIPATLLGAGHDAGVERVVLPSGVAPLHREMLAVSRPGARSPLIDELVTFLAGAVDSAQSSGGAQSGDHVATWSRHANRSSGLSAGVRSGALCRGLEETELLR